MDINFSFIFVKIQSLVKHLLNTYFVQDLVFGLKHPKFIGTMILALKNHQQKLERITSCDLI